MILRGLIFIVIMFSSNAWADADEERQEIQTMREEVLAKLYQENPEVERSIANAVGYATFSNIGVNLIFFSAGGGYGVVRENSSGNDIYMSMGTAGIGIGLGVKDFSAVFVFHTEKAFNNFVDNGWDFSGQADAAAKSGKKGGAESAAGTIINGVSVYQMTENGLALQATLQGTKFWRNKALNEAH